ncbi:MAG: hypothetical protein APR54_05770 [Candidatus Cloacimonas sp. SDB]|nr:MAG: hypothetical protein APR54_05770 [Candidatus Cloacimonas sp. SDB]
MKKTIIFMLIIWSIMNLMSLTIEHGNNSYELTWQEVKNFSPVELKTEREKDGEIKKETWLGSPLKAILTHFSITDFVKLQVAATDNYMVRLDFNEITEREPILAYSLNDEQLNEENFRLIVPGKRDMFWIRNISRIIIETEEEMDHPDIIFLAEKILQRKPLRTNPEPFEDVTGYYFKDIIEEVFPFSEGEYLLIAQDGIRHKLDYDNYLKKASLIMSDGNLALQSPQMPAGMWIKDITYIQKEETAIVFINEISEWKDLHKLLGWKENSEKLETEFNIILQRKAEETQTEKLEWY